jgi:hypothetical protein
MKRSIFGIHIVDTNKLNNVISKASHVNINAEVVFDAQNCLINNSKRVNDDNIIKIDEISSIFSSVNTMKEGTHESLNIHNPEEACKVV